MRRCRVAGGHTGRVLTRHMQNSSPPPRYLAVNVGREVVGHKVVVRVGDRVQQRREICQEIGRIE